MSFAALRPEVPLQTTSDPDSASDSGFTEARLAALAVAGGAGGDAGGVAPAGTGQEPAPARVPKGKAEANGRQKCKACLKSLPWEAFAFNSPYCRADKQAIDNLAYQAKVQDELKWWTETRADDAQLRRALSKYHEQCPRVPNLRRRSVFLIAQYREEYRAGTSVAHRAKGIMMHKARYLRYATSSADSSRPPLSLKDAELQWTAWENDANHIRDQSGPPEDPLRLRVHVDDEVNFDSTVSHSKSQVLQSQKDGKGVTEEDAQKGRRGLIRSHNRDVGRDDAEQEYGAMAQAMLAKSDGSSRAAGNVFAGTGLAVPDVGRLAEELAADGKEKEKKAKSGEPDEAASAASGTSSGVGAGADGEMRSGPSARKRKWFDTTIVAKKRRTTEEQNEKLTVALTSAVENAQAKLAEIDTLSDSDKRRYNTEQETLAWRLKRALACMGPDTSGEAEGEASLAQLRMHLNLKTKSPPCEGWEELCDLATLVAETACTFDYMVGALLP